VTTGRWKTYVAKPTSEPGVYRIPAVHPGKGAYSYSVLYGPFEQNVTVRGPSDPPASAVDETSSESDSFPVWPVLLTLLATLPIALRRRFPIAVFAVTLAAALASDVFYSNFFFPGALVALYTVAAQVGRPISIRVGVATALALTITFLDESGIEESNFGNWEDVVGRAAMYAVFAAAWLLGDNLRTRRAYLREVEERAARLEREREENIRRAAADEQARIARELHDIIAHNVSVMTVQAAAAGDAFETQPGSVREALASIESTGREALTELRRLLGSVRPGDGPEDGLRTLAPQPGLARLDDLVEQVRATGLEVELTIEGSPRELPPGIDLSSYRIVQEALTNTLKHADASQATVLVRYGDRTLDVEVVDDGRGATVDGAERGRGIIGMRADRRRARGRARSRRWLFHPCPDPPRGARSMTIRVLLCDDQALVRSGFRLILESREDIEVVGEAEDGREAIELAQRVDPDLILMDIRMPNVDGVEATRRLVTGGSRARIIVLTTFDLDEYVFESIRAGASGFLLKDVQPTQLVDAIRVVAAGEALLAPSVTRRLLDRFARTLPGEEKPPPELVSLTERELEVLKLLASGLSNAELAERLFLSETTVKSHISSVLRKLGLRDRVQAVVLAYEAGLVRPGSPA
jgi:DNA-binding NarL/FixJ family response regulator/signal transduction histidine kinase